MFVCVCAFLLHLKCIPLVCDSGVSELFVTCAEEEVRVWQTKGLKELVRIRVPNMTCNTAVVARDGKAIISGMYSLDDFTPYANG